MIVSHKHKFIFMHGLKTAGSAITLSLLRYLDRDDEWLTAPLPDIMHDALVNGIVPAPATRPAVLAEFEARRGKRAVHKALEAPLLLDADERRAFAEAYMSHQPPHPRQTWQHVWAADARDYVGRDVWNSYFKFSIERNPWDRVVSFYWWRHRRGNPAVSFPKFIRAIHSGKRSRVVSVKATQYTNWPIYTIDDELAVDYLGRYESLNDDLRIIMDKASVPFDGWLPLVKHKTRKTGVDEVYDDETLRLVGEVYHREVALLGYEQPA